MLVCLYEKVLCNNQKPNSQHLVPLNKFYWPDQQIN